MLPLAALSLAAVWLPLALARSHSSTTQASVASSSSSRHHASAKSSAALASPTPTSATPASATGSSASSAATSVIAVTGATTTIAAVATTSVATPEYARPAVPTNWAWTNPANYNPDPNWDMYAEPTTREYWWDIAYAASAPDGFPRRVTVVNGQFPGPLIEANTGDRIIVHVTNSVEEGQSIHWHGLYQNGTQYNDGVPGMTQCRIPTGTTFTYNYTVPEQYGTYWWHSHESNTMADGIFGGLIIHSPDEPAFKDTGYDEDHILFIQEWMHDQSDTIVNALLEDGGYYGSPAAPEGDAVLINGVGNGNCSAVRFPSECSGNIFADVPVPPNKKIRFRIINVGSHHLFRLSIDDHPFDVVEADGTSVSGVDQIHEVPLGPAQRYSIIVNTDKGSNGDVFWMRSRTAVQCIAGGFIADAQAKFRYVEPDSAPSTNDPDTTAWPDLLDPLTEPCIDLDNYYVVSPVGEAATPQEVLQTATFSSTFGTFVNSTGGSFLGFGMNNVSWKNTINQPLLLDIEQGRKLNPNYVASATFEGIGGGDIVINNIGGPAHPFHLHSRKFAIVARGVGNITEYDVPYLPLNTTNPLVRDTLMLDAGTYAVLRIVTDTPGVWGFHCHIGWHLAAGKLAAIVIQPDAVRDIPQPAEWQQLCYGTDPTFIGPDRRRSYPPQARAALPARFKV